MSSDITRTIYHAKGELESNWWLWEQYLLGPKNKGNYEDNMECILTIKNMRDFAGLWTKTSYAKPSTLFSDPNTNKIKR